MNALTKVFVVLLVIFSITFTMMTLQFSTSVPDWRGEAMKWKAEAQTVDTHNRNLIAAKVADAGRAAADRRAWSKERDDPPLTC